ncbi:MAG: YncE family protein, partial [Chloroflexota bacterium]
MPTTRYRNSSHLLAAICLLMLAGGISLLQPHTDIAAAQDEPTPLPLFALPDARTNEAFTSNTLAFNETNRLLVAVNALSDTLSVIAPVSGELRGQFEVGDDPRSVAVTMDGSRALIANRGDATLSVYDFQLEQVISTIALGGRWAYGVVTSSNDLAYVTLQGSNEVVVVDVIRGEVIERIGTPPLPTALALWGDFLYVTHMWSGDVSLVYLPQQRIVDTIPTGAGMSAGISVDITRGLAYLPQTRSYSNNPTATYDARLFPVVNVLSLTGFNVEYRENIPLSTADRPVNMPFATQVDPFRRWVYVANAGSNNVSVIEIESGTALASIEVGANPRGLLLNNNNTQLFVHNFIDGTLSIVDTATFNVVDSIPIDTQFTLSADVLIGAAL